MDDCMFSSAKGDWRTPECVLERVRRVGRIALDPCAGDDTEIGIVNYTKERDGLARDWLGVEVDAEEGFVSWPPQGIVYCNPPYGREIAGWAAKCAEEAASGLEIVALFPARTDTAWFDVAWQTAQCVCFWRGRIKFVGANGPAPFPSAVVYWGPHAQHFARVFQSAGKVVML